MKVLIRRRYCTIFSLVAIFVLLILPVLPSYGEPPTPYRLTLQEAIQKGLEANVNVLVAGTSIAEAEGTRERRLSSYLPHAHIETPVAYQTVNLAAEGITFSNITAVVGPYRVSFTNAPTVIGPFSSFDFRVYVDQTLIDLQSYHNIKASEKELQATRNNYKDVRNLIIRQIAGLYLNAESAAAEVEAAESRVRTSEVLEKLARDQHDTGLATGVDVLRAQVQLANDRQGLLVARNSFKQSLMSLARNIGLSPGKDIELAEKLKFRAIGAPQIEEALNVALAEREDYHALIAQRESMEEEVKAAKSRYLPRLTVGGNYGGNGQHLNEIEATYLIRANLVFTIFDLDREGEIKEVRSRLRRVEHQIADLRLGIEQDVREAMLNLESASNEVGVSESGLELAQRELDLASDRFRNGVADNVEVVNAQDALARAQENSIIAMTRHSDAKIALARALGNTEKLYNVFLGTQ
jgi:outer membrane protein TolC